MYGARVAGQSTARFRSIGSVGGRSARGIRLAAQDTALSRRRSRVRIPHALPKRSAARRPGARPSQESRLRRAGSRPLAPDYRRVVAAKVGTAESRHCSGGNLPIPAKHHNGPLIRFVELHELKASVPVRFDARQARQCSEGHKENFRVTPSIREYEKQFRSAKGAGLESTKSDYKTVNDLYYNLATDFFEYGWGRSFHFAPRVPGESFKASLTRHEHYMAHVLKLRPGMLVADLGCGVGGPLIEIARFSGARIVGVNGNAYQIERARLLTEEAKLTHLAEFLNCDFLHVDALDNSFDAIYAIEATCCAADNISIYSEVYRLLQPAASFGAYEYFLTHSSDPSNAYHLKLKSDIELGGGLLNIDNRPTVDDALRTAGFEVLEARDLSVQEGPSIPWYQPLVGPGLSLASFRSTRSGLGYPQHTASARNAPHCSAGDGSRIPESEPLRGCHGRGPPPRHLHAHVLHPCPQAGETSSRHGVSITQAGACQKLTVWQMSYKLNQIASCASTQMISLHSL